MPIDRHASSPGRSSRSALRGGYTLIELLVVVVILGVLATLITFAVLWAVRAAERAAFAENLRGFANAAHMYRTEYGYYPPEAAPGEMPEGFDKYIDTHKWTMPTPLGGMWDLTSGGGERGSRFGIGISMGEGWLDEEDDVLRQSTVQSLQDFDAAFDDGNLGTGSFRQVDSDGFYLVVAE